jgi:hypothetical protein
MDIFSVLPDPISADVVFVGTWDEGETIRVERYFGAGSNPNGSGWRQQVVQEVVL